MSNYNTTLSSDSLESGTGSSNSLRSTIQSVQSWEATVRLGPEEVGVRMPGKASQRRKAIATVNAMLLPALPMPAPRAGPRFVH
jgi:hypothetical protein